ncbi:MAG TPA: FUSC family membrane protein [Candidatus Sphingobacterium stercoripullorum]|nr:FUSC family membrane protein [Candidatus Sphingobacterium stercoripullorum]
MRQTKEIKNFFYGQYFYDGIRITLGSIIPLIVCAILEQFAIGTIMSLGALVIGLADTPGAISHRRTGMIASLLLCFVTSLLTAVVNDSVVAMTITLAVVTFLCSMLAVFNTRASTVGVMAILTMLINVDAIYGFKQEITLLLFFSLGGLWYFLVSVALVKTRPYRLAQQGLSDCIRQVADFMRLKATFYQVGVDFDLNYRKVIEQQIQVNSHQESVRELLFQSKRSIKDTTKAGRYLTLVFADIIDLYEQGTMAYYDYKEIHNSYAHTEILDKYRRILRKIATELDHIAFQLNANRKLTPLYDFQNDLQALLDHAKLIEEEEGVSTMNLKKIIINIRNIVKLLDNIYSYSHLSQEQTEREDIVQASAFVQNSKIDWSKFRENLNLRSNNFRHSLRLAITLSATYLTVEMLELGHMGTYWILLTILVILRPGFGLTKERNIQRIAGTFIGGIIGFLVLIFVQDEVIRFIFLIFFFLTAYSFFRINYIILVIFITPYVLILLSFTGMNSLDIAKARIIDTFLGGLLAFLSSYLILPSWESSQIKGRLEKVLVANYNYLVIVLEILLGNPPSLTAIKLMRKEVYIASANMSSTFQRMLTEPKWRQKSSKEVNRFTILNHIFSSYAATLLDQVNSRGQESFTQEHIKLLRNTLKKLENSIMLIPEADISALHNLDSLFKLSESEDGAESSHLITEQLQFLNKISADLHKATKKVLIKEQIIHTSDE